MGQPAGLNPRSAACPESALPAVQGSDTHIGTAEAHSGILVVGDPASRCKRRKGSPGGQGRPHVPSLTPHPGWGRPELSGALPEAPQHTWRCRPAAWQPQATCTAESGQRHAPKAAGSELCGGAGAAGLALIWAAVSGIPPPPHWRELFPGRADYRNNFLSFSIFGRVAWRGRGELGGGGSRRRTSC